MNLFTPAMGPEEIILLLRNLGVMLKAGVPLSRSLSIVEGDAPKRKRAVIAHLRQSVEAGRPLAQAMETSPRRFPPLAINLVRTGELSGTLEESLAAIVQRMRAAQDLKQKIRGALMYPAFVLIAIVGLGLSVGILVLPKLIPLFESLNMDLPWSTRAILWVARFFKAYGIWTGVGGAMFCGFLIVVSSAQSTKPLVHRFLLSLPLLRTIQINACVAEIAGTLSTLLQSGIALPAALEATAKAVRNRVFRAAILRMIPRVSAGQTLAASVRGEGRLFPTMAGTLIAVGEESGTLAQTMEYIATSYEAEVDHSVKNMTTALEPMLLIGIGLIVGFTVISIITPIYNVTSGVQ